MIKVIFFDIDGTLVSFQTHKIPATTLKVLFLLRKQGIKLFAATGRAPVGMEFLKEYFHFDGMICFNGEYFFDDDGVIFQDPLPAETVENIVPYLSENKIACCFETLNRSVFNLIDQKVVDLLTLVGQTKEEQECADMATLNEDVYQLTAYVSAEQEAEVMRRMRGCKAVRWYSTFVNIIGERSGKPIGIAKVCEKYGFAREEIMAFGDGGNDIDMLRYAGAGIAMGNASDVVKKSADYVTSSVDDAAYLTL